MGLWAKDKKTFYECVQCQEEEDDVDDDDEDEQCCLGHLSKIKSEESSEFL